MSSLMTAGLEWIDTVIDSIIFVMIILIPVDIKIILSLSGLRIREAHSQLIVWN